MIHENGIYESADPRDKGRQIRVVEWNKMDQKAQIVSHPQGNRKRYVEARTLHDDPFTAGGEKRRTGYFFVRIHTENADA